MSVKIEGTLESFGWLLMEAFITEKETREWRSPDGIFQRFLIGILDEGDTAQLELVKTYLKNEGIFSYYGLEDHIALSRKGPITAIEEILDRSGYFAQFKYIRPKEQWPPRDRVVQGIIDLTRLTIKYDGNLHAFYKDIASKTRSPTERLKVIYDTLVKPTGEFKISNFGDKKFYVLMRDLAYAFRRYPGSWGELPLEHMEIPIDVHVREFFKQLGWAATDEDIVPEARKRFKYPVIADIAIWVIHRTLCKQKRCDVCFIRPECSKGKVK